MLQIFTLEPITEVSIVEFFLYFLAYMGLSYAVNIVTFAITKKTVIIRPIPKIYRTMDLPTLLLGTVIEEIIFRGSFWMFAGDKGALFGTVVWAVYHFTLNQILGAFVFGILLYRYWAGGLPLHAILSHVLLNLIGYALIKKIKE